MSTIKTNAITTVAGKPILNSTGSILQVVQTIKTDTFSTSATGATAITGLSVSVTPSSTSSKILIMYSINYDSTRGNSGGGFRIYRGATRLTGAEGTGSGSRYTVTGDFGANANADQSGMHRSFTYLDSPSTTSPLAYQIYIFQDTNTYTTHINRARTDANDADDPRMSSTITLMEVSA